MTNQTEKTVYKFGDIYLTKFHPVRGSEIGKYRPAVVVNEQINKIDDRLVMIAPITSARVDKRNEFELVLKKDRNLKKTSYLLLWYLRVIDVNRLEYKIGTLPKSAINRAKAALKNLMTA